MRFKYASTSTCVPGKDKNILTGSEISCNNVQEQTHLQLDCPVSAYRAASVSKIDKIISLFCKRAVPKRQYSAKEPYDSIESINRSHSVADVHHPPRKSKKYSLAEFHVC